MSQSEKMKDYQMTKKMNHYPESNSMTEISELMKMISECQKMINESIRIQTDTTQSIYQLLQTMNDKIDILYNDYRERDLNNSLNPNND